jgi:hypothetical protein
MQILPYFSPNPWSSSPLPPCKTLRWLTSVLPTCHWVPSSGPRWCMTLTSRDFSFCLSTTCALRPPWLSFWHGIRFTSSGFTAWIIAQPNMAPHWTWISPEFPCITCALYPDHIGT